MPDGVELGIEPAAIVAAGAGGVVDSGMATGVDVAGAATGYTGTACAAGCAILPAGASLAITCPT